MAVRTSKARSEALGIRKVLFEFQGSMSDPVLRNLCFLPLRNEHCGANPAVPQLQATAVSIRIFCVQGVQAEHGTVHTHISESVDRQIKTSQYY